MKPLELTNYLLWADGMISVSPEFISDFVFKLSSKNLVKRLHVTEMTEEIKSYNRIADNKIQVKTEVDSTIFPPNWILPDRYKYLDLDSYLLDLVEKIEQDDLYSIRLKRLAEEISLYQKLDLDNVLKALIYVIETFEEQDVVWGVGRGSSCSSYLLYLMGLHEVDCVKYNIKITDFLKI